jgi:hypothetical protein
MASSIILCQSGDSKYENSGGKFNNKAGCDIAAFGGREYFQGSSKKSLEPAAAFFLRRTGTTAEGLFAIYKNKQLYHRLIRLMSLHPVTATAWDPHGLIATAGELLKSKRRCSIRVPYIQRQTKCSR